MRLAPSLIRLAMPLIVAMLLFFPLFPLAATVKADAPVTWRTCTYSEWAWGSVGVMSRSVDFANFVDGCHLAAESFNDEPMFFLISVESAYGSEITNVSATPGFNLTSHTELALTGYTETYSPLLIGNPPPVFPVMPPDAPAPIVNIYTAMVPAAWVGSGYGAGFYVGAVTGFFDLEHSDSMVQITMQGACPTRSDTPPTDDCRNVNWTAGDFGDSNEVENSANTVTDIMDFTGSSANSSTMAVLWFNASSGAITGVTPDNWGWISPGSSVTGGTGVLSQNAMWQGTDMKVEFSWGGSYADKTAVFAIPIAGYGGGSGGGSSGESACPTAGPNTSTVSWLLAFLLLFTPCALMWTMLKAIGLVVSEQTFVFMTNLGLILGGLLGLAAQVMPLGVVAFIVIIFLVSLWKERG